MGVAGPNEVLVTEDLRGMAEPEEVLFDPVGDVELKGIASPVPLHQARRP